MLNWLQNLSGGAATFVGAFTGASIGVVALLVGALFNARLNRKRDDRQRWDDARSVAAALKAELAGLNRTLKENADQLEREPPKGPFLLPDLAHSVRVIPHMLPKIGLLNIETIRDVIDAYIVVEQYYEQLVLRGGQLDEHMSKNRRLIFMMREHASSAVHVNRGVSKTIETAIARLDEFLQRRVD